MKQTKLPRVIRFRGSEWKVLGMQTLPDEGHTADIHFLRQIIRVYRKQHIDKQIRDLFHELGHMITHETMASAVRANMPADELEEQIANSAEYWFELFRDNPELRSLCNGETNVE